MFVQNYTHINKFNSAPNLKLTINSFIMKKKFAKKIVLSFALSIMAVSAYAQVSVGDIRSELESSKDDIFGIINIIMAIISFGGVIYVASALIGKREMSKGVLIGWVSAMAIWGMAVTLID